MGEQVKNKRVLAAGLVAIAGVVVILATIPRTSDSVAGVLLTADLNNARAEGAPQQSVVAQWATRDLLAIQAQEDQAFQWRVSLLLGLLIIVALLILLALPQKSTAAPDTDPPTTPQPASAPQPVASSAGESATGTALPPPSPSTMQVPPPVTPPPSAP